MNELIPEITAWLQQPQAIRIADHAAIHQLAKQYPYFVPAQFLEAAISHKQSPFNEALLSKLRLHGGNYIMLQQLLATALQERNEEDTVAEAVPEAAIAPQLPQEHKPTKTELQAPLIQPAFTEDYFRHQGIEAIAETGAETGFGPLLQQAATSPDKSLLVMMSFAEWLAHYKTKSQKEKEEEESRRSLRSMWQKEKLAAAMEEENEEIPEQVFEMAVNSIAHEDGLISESLAAVHVKQGKIDKAIEMYRKLGLRNPAKSAYFAQQIENLHRKL